MKSLYQNNFSLKPKSQKRVLNNRGQVSVEYILIAVMLMSLATFIGKRLREGEYLSQLVSAPWNVLSGMIEAGVWESSSKARVIHPGSRGISYYVPSEMEASGKQPW